MDAWYCDGCGNWIEFEQERPTYDGDGAKLCTSCVKLYLPSERDVEFTKSWMNLKAAWYDFWALMWYYFKKG